MGELLSADVASLYTFDEEGEVVRWYGFTEDVHEQRLAETARERAEERYRLAARATNDAIWDLDLEKNLIHWSDSSADALGYPGQVLGTTPLGWWSERVHPEDRLSASDSLTEAIETGKTRWSASYRFRQSDGEYATFYDRGFIMRDEDGRLHEDIASLAPEGDLRMGALPQANGGRRLRKLVLPPVARHAVDVGQQFRMIAVRAAAAGLLKGDRLAGMRANA